MTLHRKCAIFLVVLCTMSVWPCFGSESKDNTISEDSDEDQKLKQALVLVDLLKKEYVRALRENYELRKKETTVIERSTIASTDGPASTSQSPAPALLSTTSQEPDPIPNALNKQEHWRRRMMNVRLQPSVRKFPGGIDSNKPYPQFYRRRIPVDYYYDDAYDIPINSFRRQSAFRRNNEQYESTTEAVSNAVTTDALDSTTVGLDTEADTTVVSDITDTTTSNTTDTPDQTITALTTDASNTTDTPDETNTSGITDTLAPEDRIALTDKPITTDTSEVDNTSEPSTATVLNTVSEQFPVDETNGIITTTEDPLQSQVASQLIIELKAGMNEKFRLKNYTPVNTENERNNLYYMKLMKPTLKMYLGGSTRIPIPLPENHAFCYTNPKNLLCRASI